MKKLELNQMENLEGGSISCGIAIVSTLVGLALAPATFGLSVEATIFFGSLSIVDSCIGWA
jgi:hypothetical protein